MKNLLVSLRWINKMAFMRKRFSQTGSPTDEGKDHKGRETLCNRDLFPSFSDI